MPIELLTLFSAAGVGLVLLLALWPTPDRAQRLLQRWGVPEPDDAERAEALRYLRRRRVLYPAVYVALTPLFGRRDDGSPVPDILVCLVVGAVVGELLAQRPPSQDRREAALTDRRVRDLLPRWAVTVWAAVAAAAVGVPVLAVAGVPLGLAAPGLPAVVAGVATLAGLLVVGLAVRRPPVRLDRADTALRLRSARVGAGLAMASAGLTTTLWHTTVAGVGGIALAALLVGLIGWRLAVLPVRTVPALTV